MRIPFEDGKKSHVARCIGDARERVEVFGFFRLSGVRPFDGNGPHREILRARTAIRLSDIAQDRYRRMRRARIGLPETRLSGMLRFVKQVGRIS